MYQGHMGMQAMPSMIVSQPIPAGPRGAPMGQVRRPPPAPCACGCARATPAAGVSPWSCCTSGAPGDSSLHSAADGGAFADARWRVHPDAAALQHADPLQPAARDDAAGDAPDADEHRDGGCALNVCVTCARAHAAAVPSCCQLLAHAKTAIVVSPQHSTRLTDVARRICRMAVALFMNLPAIHEASLVVPRLSVNDHLRCLGRPVPCSLCQRSTTIEERVAVVVERVGVSSRNRRCAARSRAALPSFPFAAACLNRPALPCPVLTTKRRVQHDGPRGPRVTFWGSAPSVGRRPHGAWRASV